MIIIAGTIPIRADARQEAIAAAAKMAAATQQEAGCITYDFYTNISDPNTILVYEVWESEEALAGHFQAPHMAEFRKVLPNVVAGKGELKKYTVSSVADL